MVLELLNCLHSKYTHKNVKNNTKTHKSVFFVFNYLSITLNRLFMNNLEFKKIRKNLSLTQKELADKLGYSLSSIQKWESGDRIVDDFTADKLLKLSQTITRNESLLEAPQIVEKQSGVPYYDIDYAGGWSSDELFTEHLPSFYITSPDFDKADFACNLIGQSISRRIPHRAVIGLRQINDWETYFPTNEVYAVLMKNDLRTVKIVKRSKREGFLTLIPDPLPEYNQTGYENEEVPLSFVSKMFQVVAWAQFERVAM